MHIVLFRYSARVAKLLLFKKHHKELQLIFNDFSNLILWLLTNKVQLIALDPWSGLYTSVNATDNFIDKQGVAIIQPLGSESKRFTLEISC